MLNWKLRQAGFSPLAAQGAAFGPMAIAGAGLALSAVSTGMSIIGSSQQAAAQRQQGQIAYTNSVLAQQAAYQRAAQEDQAAGLQVAAGQRQQLEAQRKGQVMAGRARAVMAASGAGVDENLVASLAGEGNYEGDVAAYNANEKGRGLYNQAKIDRYAGDAGVFTGSETQSADNSAAGATLFGGVAKGVGQIGQAGLGFVTTMASPSFAEKYAGSGFGVTPDSSPRRRTDSSRTLIRSSDDDRHEPG